IMGQRNETDKTQQLIKKNSSKSPYSNLAHPSPDYAWVFVTKSCSRQLMHNPDYDIKSEPDDSRSRFDAPQRIGVREGWKGIFQLCEPLTGMGE
ncbi:MAG: hypothetical protein V3T61_05750, partial [Acidobacteriota bacterium]